MGALKRLDLWGVGGGNCGVFLRITFGLYFAFLLFCPVTGLRPLRERYQAWGDEVSIKVQFFFHNQISHAVVFAFNWEWNLFGHCVLLISALGFTKFLTLSNLLEWKLEKCNSYLKIVVKFYAITVFLMYQGNFSAWN